MEIVPGIRALLLAMLFVVTGSAASAQTLPLPWGSIDIGDPEIAGRSTYSSGAFTITAESRDVWDTSDQFHFVYRPVTGDLEIVARVVSITTEANRWSKAGVMIRESLTAQSPHAMMVGSAGAGYAFQRRVNTAGSSDSTDGPATAPPAWVRLVRKGDLFSGYYSADGTSWQLVDSDTVPMGDTVYVGLLVSSHNSAVAATGLIDSVTLTAASLPNSPPAISITAPIANAQYTAPATIAINATATDPEEAMLSVDFYANQTLISRETTAPYSATFVTSTEGTYSLTAVAHDGDGNSTTSGAVLVTVQAASNQVPIVSLTSPATGAEFTAPATIDLAADAADPENQLARVEFLSGTTVLGTDTTAPYSLSWTNVAAGTYSLTARAYDSDGASATSAAVSVTVTAATGELPAANGAPSVALKAPANGEMLTAPATIDMAADAADPENQLARVEFLWGTTVLETDTTAPYSFSWRNVAAGTYSLMARAYDSVGASTTSAAVTVTVVETSSDAPTTVIFTASADHSTNVTSYQLAVYTAGSNPSTATPVATSDLGKPIPDANNDITVNWATFFSALAPGNYIATVTAIGPAGQTPSTAVPFTR